MNENISSWGLQNFLQSKSKLNSEHEILSEKAKPTSFFSLI